MYGKKRRNQEIPLCPLLHNTFKNHVQNRTKPILTIRVNGLNFLNMPNTMRNADITKYMNAGVHNFDRDIILYIMYIKLYNFCIVIYRHLPIL